jgi:hypothetical protein
MTPDVPLPGYAPDRYLSLPDVYRRPEAAYADCWGRPQAVPSLAETTLPETLPAPPPEVIYFRDGSGKVIAERLAPPPDPADVLRAAAQTDTRIF